MLLITADLHLNANPRDEYRHEFQKELRAMVRKYKPAGVALLGDLTDFKDEHPAVLVNRIVDHLYRLAQLAPVVVLRGNHDMAGEPAFFAFAGRSEGIWWVGAPTMPGELENAPTALLEALGKALFLPHSHDPRREWADLPKWARWIFAHQTFAGARNERGTVLDGAPPSLIPKGARVVSGDVHVPQDGLVTYVGAPYTIDFGDDYAPRVLLLQNDKLTSLPCTGPQKRLIIFKHGNTIHNAKPGDIVKIQVQLDRGDYARWGEIKDKAASWAQKLELNVHMIQPVVAAAARMSSKRPRSEPKSDRELVENYAKAAKLDELTVKVGMNLLG